MATTYITEKLTLNVAPTTIFQADTSKSFILAKTLLKNERNEGVKVTVNLNGYPLIVNLEVPVFSQKPVEIETISKLKLVGTDSLDILVVPNSLSGATSFGIVGGFPWYTQVDANVATIIMSYIKITS